MSRFATLLLLIATLGCSSDESPTSPGTSVCTDPWPATSTWAVRGGCEGGLQTTHNGSGAMQFNNTACTLTVDVTPSAEKANGAQWTMTADLRNRTARVVRTNGVCPATDTGTLRIEQNAVVASFRADALAGCQCRLNYTVNIGRPQ